METNKNNLKEAFVTSNGEELLILASAARERVVSQSYLRYSIFNKKLRGIKIEGVWYTTQSWLDEYFSSIIPRKARTNGTNGFTNGVPNIEKIAAREKPVEKQKEEERIPMDKFNERLAAMEQSLNKAERRLIRMGLAAALISVVSISFVISPHTLQGAKTFVSRLQKFTLPHFAGSHSFYSVSRIVPDAVSDFSDVLDSLYSKTSSVFFSMRNKIDIVMYDFYISSIQHSIPRTNLAFSLPSLPFLTSLKNVILSPAESWTKNLIELFRSPLSSTSEIPIPTTPEHENIKTQEHENTKTFLHEVESRFSGIEPRKVSPPIPAESGTKQSSSNTSSISSQLFSSLATLNQKLREEFFQTTNDLNNRISTLGDKQTSQSRIISLTQKIDQLDGQTLKNITFQGGANQFNLKDTDIPDDITVTGAISPTQLTVSNTLTVQGAGTSTYSGGIQAKALNITSTTATSTFSNGIQLGGGALKTVKEIV